MKKTAVLGMLVCAAMMLSYVESLVELTPSIPGIKIGLANLVIVICLYRYGEREAFLVNLARVVLGAFLFGSLFSLLYSLAGAFFSLAAMVAGKRRLGFSLVGVSVCGGVCHNLGQLFMAMAVLQSVWVIFYLPWLLLAGCAAGILIGICAGRVCRRLPGSDDAQGTEK